MEIDDTVADSLKKDDALIKARGKIKIDKLLKRPEFRIQDILGAMNYHIDPDLAAIVEMEIKYEGYIARDQERIRKIEKMEKKSIPADIDYSSIIGLKKEAKEKLIRIKPSTVGQAIRISGVDPSDISILLVHIEAMNKHQKEVPRGTQ